MPLQHPVLIQLITVIGYCVILNAVTGIKKEIFTLFEAQ